MLFKTMSAVIASAFVLAAAVAADTPSGEDETVYVRGWLELARVQPVDLLMRAKLDSGAKTTALHADILRGPEEYGYPAELDDGVAIDIAAEGEGETVVFAIESRRGQRVVFERNIVRWVQIKDRRGGLIRRPVVNMAFCIGGVFVEGDVGLTDRGDFNYPLLVGRRMLTKAKVMVASWETFTHESRCYEDGPRPND